MAFVRVEQRNARLAGPVRIDYVNGRDGEIAKVTVTVINNTRQGTGDERTEEATAIQWTLWGRQAENAAKHLGKGAHVNIIGRLRNNHYTDANGATVYGFDFTCEELDYLDSKAEAQAREERQEWTDAYDAASPATRNQPAKSSPGNGRRAAAN